MEQLNNEIYENWCSMNIDETTVMVGGGTKFTMYTETSVK